MTTLTYCGGNTIVSRGGAIEGGGETSVYV